MQTSIWIFSPNVSMRKMKQESAYIAILTLLICCGVCYAPIASAGRPDAVIRYRLGIQALADGEPEKARDHYKRSCLDPRGVVEACLGWADLASTPKEQGRSLSAAVYLDPSSFEAHYRLGLYFLTAEDFVFADLELKAALEHASNEERASWCHLALGYSLHRQKEYYRLFETSDH